MDSNFNDGFQPLTCDEDVLMLGKDTFTVGRFKELVHQEVRSKIFSQADSYGGFIIFDKLNRQFYLDNKVAIGFTESYWETLSQEIECQILGVGYSGWKKGKVQIKTHVNFEPQDYAHYSYKHRAVQYPKASIKVELEFSSDEPNEYQSPLDKLRQLESDL